MISITALLKSILILSCYLLTQAYLFDFSNYPKDSKFFDETNKKVIGKMEDESQGKIVGEFVGLKLKMYSMKNIDGKESNTARGVNIGIEFNEFKDTLFNKKYSDIKSEEFKAKNIKWEHTESTKYHYLFNGIHTVAYFHKDLKNHR